MTGFEWMLLVLLSVVWGGSFFFNGIALREFPTLTIVTARVGLAALALLFLTRMLGQGIQLNRQILKAFFGMSFLNNVVPFSLIVWGQQHIASGVASILNATTPLFTGMSSLLGIALLSTALAYVIYFRLLKTAGATNLLLVTLLIPVSAIILGVFLLGESLEPQHLSGMAIISLGLLIMDGRLLQFFRKTFSA